MSNDFYPGVRLAAIIVFVLLAWLAALVAAPMINGSNSVTVIGGGQTVARAIARSGARIHGRRGPLLLVQREKRNLAQDLIDNGAGLVVPDEIFLAFRSSTEGHEE